MNTNNQKIRSEIANEVFYDLPPLKERQRMTAEELAILLSDCEVNTPKYILIEHELNLRIVKEQNKTTLKTGFGSAIIGLLGILVGALLSCQ